jgi:hypothetical protein
VPSIDVASVTELRWFRSHALRALDISRRLRELQYELSGALGAAQASSNPAQINVGFAAKYAARDDDLVERVSTFVTMTIDRDRDGADSPRLVATATAIRAACVPLDAGLGAVKASTGASYGPAQELLMLLRAAADRLDDLIASCVAALAAAPYDPDNRANWS